MSQPQLLERSVPGVLRMSFGRRDAGSLRALAVHGDGRKLGLGRRNRCVCGARFASAYAPTGNVVDLFVVRRDPSCSYIGIVLFAA
jgi:hypothetical protein